MGQESADGSRVWGSEVRSLRPGVGGQESRPGVRSQESEVGSLKLGSRLLLRVGKLNQTYPYDENKCLQMIAVFTTYDRSFVLNLFKIITISKLILSLPRLT